MNSPELQRRQQWTIFVDNATPDLSSDTVAAAVMLLASRTDSGGLPPRVHVIAEDVADLVYVDGVGWVCPACWARSLARSGAARLPPCGSPSLADVAKWSVRRAVCFDVEYETRLYVARRTA